MWAREKLPCCTTALLCVCDGGGEEEKRHVPDNECVLNDGGPLSVVGLYSLTIKACDSSMN
jgi:hypothetical protein